MTEPLWSSSDEAIGAPSKEFDSLFRFGPDGLVDPSYGAPDSGLTLPNEYDDERVQLAPLGANTMRLGSNERLRPRRP